jgi:hypothetical protein
MNISVLRDRVKNSTATICDIVGNLYGSLSLCVVDSKTLSLIACVGYLVHPSRLER